MSKLQHFLNDLSDSELANFYYYRYEQFLKKSKERIDLELSKRGIDKLNPGLKNAYNSEQNAEHCPRCGSSKFYNSRELETITYRYASVDLEVDYRTCLVCLFSEDKEKSKGRNRFVGPFGFIKALINRKK